MGTQKYPLDTWNPIFLLGPAPTLMEPELHFLLKHTERSPSYSQSMKNVGINLNNYPFPSDRGEGEGGWDNQSDREGAGIIRDTLSLSAHHNIFSCNYLKNYYQIQIIFCRKNDPGKTSIKLKT
jgi:hypothetical protein